MKLAFDPVAQSPLLQNERNNVAYDPASWRCDDGVEEQEVQNPRAEDSVVCRDAE